MTSRPAIGRTLLFLLGGWLFLSLSMSFVASANFAILKPANLRSAETVYASIPAGEPRNLALRYAASEINRSLFRNYNRVQLGLALLCLVLNTLSGDGGRWRRFLLLLAFALCAVFVWSITPWMIDHGRQIDFMSRDPEPEAVTKFKRLHSLSVGMELVKMASILAVGVAIIRDRRRDSRTTGENA